MEKNDSLVFKDFLKIICLDYILVCSKVAPGSYFYSIISFANSAKDRKYSLTELSMVDDLMSVVVMVQAVRRTETNSIEKVPTDTKSRKVKMFSIKI